MDLKEIAINMRNWVDSAQDRDYWRVLVCMFLYIYFLYLLYYSYLVDTTTLFIFLGLFDIFYFLFILFFLVINWKKISQWIYYMKNIITLNILSLQRTFITLLITGYIIYVIPGCKQALNATILMKYNFLFFRLTSIVTREFTIQCLTVQEVSLDHI